MLLYPIWVMILHDLKVRNPGEVPKNPNALVLLSFHRIIQKGDQNFRSNDRL